MKKFIFISLLLCCSLSAWSELKYLEITSLQGAPQVHVEKIEDIQFLVDYHKIEIGYLLKTSEKVQLILMAEGSYFTFDLNGYNSIDTYLAGSKGGFKNGADYNEALHLGLSEVHKPDSTLFYFYKRNTFKSVEDCKDAYKKGYAFLEEPKKESEKTQSQQGKNVESQAYYKGERAQLANYKEYCEFNPSLEQGYKTKADILDARKKGFEAVKGYEYYMAMERGFSKYEDYKAASDLGLESKENYDRYNKIVKEVESIEKRQKIEKNDAFTYFYLCQIPKGQQSSDVLLKTLEDLYQEQGKQVQVALDLYLSEIPSLTEWDKERSSRYRSGKYRYYSASPYLSKNTLVDFFKRVDVSRIGNFDEEADIFTRNGSYFIQLAKNKPIPPVTETSDVEENL